MHSFFCAHKTRKIFIGKINPLVTEFQKYVGKSTLFTLINIVIVDNLALLSLVNRLVRIIFQCMHSIYS